MISIGRLFLMVTFFASLNPLSSQAQDVDCSSLDNLSCMASNECMLDQQNGTKAYTCMPAWDRCQIGFQQAILDNAGKFIDWSRHEETENQCLAQRGCSYVPAGSCFCPPDVACICGGGTPPNCLPFGAADLTPPIGTYTVVDIRKASGVAGISDLSEFQDAIGETVEFGQVFVSIEGLSCDEWEVRAVEPVVDLFDPLLSDVMMPPLSADVSDGDKRIMDGWNYGCEGESFLNVLQVDDRVLVVSRANGEVNLILERPLTTAQITQLQTELKSTKFFEGEPTGVLDDPTLSAIASWAEYRSDQPDPYRFFRTAITENLFDRMGVFQID